MPHATLLPADLDAHTEAAARRQRLDALLRGSPAGLASLAGPGHLVTVTNPLFRQLVGGRLLAGLPLRTALPELPEASFFALLDEAYRTGTTCHSPAPVALADAARPGAREVVYLTFMAQAVRDAAGAVAGLLLFAYNVTAHVHPDHFTDLPPDTLAQLAAANEQLAVAKEELDVTNEELLVSNEELQASNKELLVANEELRASNESMRAQAAALRRAEQAVRRLNDELTLTNAGLADTITDSLQATEVARADAEAQRQRLHRLVAEAPALIAILTGPDCVVELANDDFRALLGHRALVGQPLRQAVPELLGQPLFEQLDQVYRSGETYSGFDEPLLLDRTNSGQLAPCYATYVVQATRNGAGHIEGLLIFGYEVTGQVLARQEREATARQRQLVTDALPALISYVDQAERYQFTNQAYEGWFRQSPAALRGQHLRAVVGEAAYAVAQPYIARALAGERVDFEARMPYRDNLVKYISTSMVPDVREGQVLGYYCLITDITEQVLARGELERQRQQLHDLLMAAPGPITILEGEELVFALVNPAYQQLFPEGALLGQPLLAALPGLAATALPGLCRRAYTTGTTCRAEELGLPLPGPDSDPENQAPGSYWTFTCQARHNAQGAVDGVVVFAHDVTSPVRARRAAEASQQHTQALNHHLARTNEELDTFVYSASHDLQGPLTNIASLLHELHQALPAAAQPPLAARMLGLLTTSVERLQGTLTQLGTIAHTQATASLPTPPVALAEVVQGVLLDLAGPIAEAGAQLTVDVADCPLVEFSEKGLRSIVYNLVSNAVKYRHPDRVPQVRVQCRQQAQFWVLEVQDNGLGLALPAGEPGFGLFRRFHTHVDGSGVGLYLVQKLVEREGGRLEVASQLGQGSTFTAYCKR